MKGPCLVRAHLPIPKRLRAFRKAEVFATALAFANAPASYGNIEAGSSLSLRVADMGGCMVRESG